MNREREDVEELIEDFKRLFRARAKRYGIIKTLDDEYNGLGKGKEICTLPLDFESMASQAANAFLTDPEAPRTDDTDPDIELGKRLRNRIANEVWEEHYSKAKMISKYEVSAGNWIENLDSNISPWDTVPLRGERKTPKKTPFIEDLLQEGDEEDDPPLPEKLGLWFYEHGTCDQNLNTFMELLTGLCAYAAHADALQMLIPARARVELALKQNEAFRRAFARTLAFFVIVTMPEHRQITCIREALLRREALARDDCSWGDPVLRLARAIFAEDFGQPTSNDDLREKTGLNDVAARIRQIKRKRRKAGTPPAE